MAYEGPIYPHYGTGTLAAPTASASTISLPPRDKQVMLSNLSATLAVYFRITAPDDTSVATSADCIVLPGERTLVSKFEDWTRMSIVCPGGTGGVHVIGCEGATSV